MDKDEFRQWLLGKYRPHVELGRGEEGGYLIPASYPSDKPGRKAAAFRFLGRLLHNTYLYELGIEYVDLAAEIIKGAQRKANG
jgi:hypothetical protein